MFFVCPLCSLRFQKNNHKEHQGNFTKNTKVNSGLKQFSLNIADYLIHIESGRISLKLMPSERFKSFLSEKTNCDIHIIVYPGKLVLPSGLKKVFEAPYVEEVNGIPVKKRDKFWSVFKHNDDLFIHTDFPLSNGNKSGTLKFSLSSRSWELWIENAGGPVDPLEYPLDGLILYYLTAIHKDIMIHASGVHINDKGFIFSGISGKGKTTMARLWDNSGAKVIHDDRLIIRRIEGKYKMFNTPVYKNDVPSESVLSKIFLIEHGKKNELITVTCATSVSLVMANCIQHNWDPEIISGLLDSVSKMCSSIPVSKLCFVPDRSVIDFFSEYE